MELKEYFEKTNGLGILSTADGDGRVNAAIFARPHVMDEKTVAFIMPHKLTHNNLGNNPYAIYVFKEDSHGYRGKRLYLKRIREEQDTELLFSLRRRKYSPEREEKMKPLFLVFFEIEKELPLVGTGGDEYYDSE